MNDLGFLIHEKATLVTAKEKAESERDASLARAEKAEAELKAREWDLDNVRGNRDALLKEVADIRADRDALASMNRDLDAQLRECRDTAGNNQSVSAVDAVKALAKEVELLKTARDAAWLNADASLAQENDRITNQRNRLIQGMHDIAGIIRKIADKIPGIPKCVKIAFDNTLQYIDCLLKEVES